MQSLVPIRWLEAAQTLLHRFRAQSLFSKASSHGGLDRRTGMPRSGSVIPCRNPEQPWGARATAAAREGEIKQGNRKAGFKFRFLTMCFGIE